MRPNASAIKTKSEPVDRVYECHHSQRVGVYKKRKGRCKSNLSSRLSLVALHTLVAFLLLRNGAVVAAQKESAFQAWNDIMMESQMEFPMEMPIPQASNRTGTVESQLDIPDTFVTQSPTLAPSVSGEPSFLPSLHPTLQPSASGEPSFQPTLHPTLQPSVSGEPSFQPTEKPSISGVPSFQPTLMPSTSPSIQPTSKPSISGEPSFQPTMMPSTSPSIQPTEKPSISGEPSFQPTLMPSTSPSTSPTMYPTLTPVPTTKSPTETPSASPSDVPSASPTLECHDVAAYRSPINDLSCEDHANTDCTRWRYVGLNLTDLQELVESCPETCNIDCGYFTVLNTNISFVIKNVPGLIDDLKSRIPLETTTQEYLTEYVLKTSPVSQFALTRVELLFQEPLNSTIISSSAGNATRKLAPRLRRNDNETVAVENNIDLQVKVNLQGFKVYPILIVVTDLMLQGIDSPDYTTELRLSNIFFANATVTLATEATPVPAPPAKERSNVSTVSVAVITVIICSVAIFGGALLYKKRTRVRKAIIRELPVANQDTPQHSTEPVRANVFSFDLSPASSTGFGRLLAVFSNGSREATSPSSSQQATTATTPQKSKVEEHPLTGIIPPMLVIDNIEDSDGNTSTMKDIPETPGTQKQVIVPTRRMEASSSFVEALNNNQRGKKDSSSTYGELI